MNTSAITTSFKKDLLNGIHAFGTTVYRPSTDKDIFKAALYAETASIDASTIAYTTSGEITGANYNAGGVEITMAIEPSSDAGVAFVTPSASIIYSNVSIAESFNCILIYNETSAGKNSVSSHTFPPQTILAGTLVITMPANDSTNALIRLA